jgi:GGDEF domain-containing protein
MRPYEKAAILDTIAANLEAPVYAVDRDLRYTYFNSFFASMLRRVYGADAMLGEKAYEAVSDDGRRRVVLGHLRRALAGARVVEEIPVSVDDATVRRYELTYSPIRGGAATGGVTVFGIRSPCLDAIDRTLKQLRHTPGRHVAIFSVGFERLQRVADVFGYPVLDRLLLEAARRIELVLGPSDAVFRTGETRLALIIGDVGDNTRAIALANSLAESLRQSCQVDGGRFYLDPHIGVACVVGGYECTERGFGRRSTQRDSRRGRHSQF